MNDTTMTREALITGIERMASSVEDITVLHRVWKILDRECSTFPGWALQAMTPNDTLRYYARHLSRQEAQETVHFIHTLHGFLL